MGCGEQHPRAVYRVDLRVRDVRRGTCAFRRFAFPVELDTANVSVTGDWLFFRGMTLEVGFSREGNALKVNRAEPVFPYPPYAKDGICLYTAPSEIPACSPFCGRLNAIHDIRENAKESRHVSKGLALVQYGDRELAVFASSTNLVTGMCGTYPDYGASVKHGLWRRRFEPRLLADGLVCRTAQGLDCGRRRSKVRFGRVYREYRIGSRLRPPQRPLG